MRIYSTKLVQAEYVFNTFFAIIIIIIILMFAFIVCLCCPV
jgi:hypothetical protein